MGARIAACVHPWYSYDVRHDTPAGRSNDKYHGALLRSLVHGCTFATRPAKHLVRQDAQSSGVGAGNDQRQAARFVMGGQTCGTPVALHMGGKSRNPDVPQNGCSSPLG